MFRFLISFSILFLSYTTEASSFYEQEHKALIQELKENKRDTKAQVNLLTNYLIQVKKLRNQIKKKANKDSPEYAQFVTYWVSLRLAFFNFEDTSQCESSKNSLRRSLSPYNSEQTLDETQFPKGMQDVSEILDQICN